MQHWRLMILAFGLAATPGLLRGDVGEGQEVFINEEWGYGLEYPAGWTVGVDVENSSDRPETVVRQRMTFRGPGGEAIYVSVWENLSALGLEKWAETYRNAVWGEPQGAPRRAGSAVAGVPAMIFEIPAGPQAFGEWIAFFAGKGTFFEISYVNSDQEASWPFFQIILDSFSLFPQSSGAK